MPTDPVTLALALLLPVAFVAGVLVARAVCRRRYRADRTQLEAHMTAKLQERYAAYVELEQQVQRIFGRLDELEAETSRSLEATGVHIRELDELMAVCEGRSAPAEAEDGQRDEPSVAAEQGGSNSLGWMDALDEVLEVYCEDETLPGETPAPEAAGSDESIDAPAEEPAQGDELTTTTVIAEWEQKLEALRDEKRDEIERQGRVIVELRERLQRLQTQPEADRAAAPPSEAVPAPQARPAGEHEAVLAKELHLWQHKYHALQRERTHDEAEVLALREEAVRLAARVTELEPLLAIQDELNERVSVLEGELAERREQLERARVETAEREEQLEGSRAELAERQAQLENARRETRAGEERAAQAERRHAEAESERRAEITALELRIQDLEPLLGLVAELRVQIEECEQREAAQVERAGALEADGRRLRGEIESLRGERKAATEMLSASKRALEEADERQRELEQRVASLAERNEGLARELSETRRSSEGQTTRISTLMARLDEVRSDSESLRREAEIRGSMVEAAEGLLAELKPKLEALEARLHQRSDG